MLNYKSIIDESVLFYSSPELRKYIPEGQFDQILNTELWEWISAIYWGETLGIEYALKMYELSESDEERTTWLDTYAEEVDHQQRLANWLVNNKTYPLPPTLMMKRAQRIIEKGRKAKNFKEYQEVIEKGQIFFEETGACLIKWRSSYVKDRSLRAILYKISKDEASHISNGKRKLNEFQEYSKTRAENLVENIGTLFPIHIAKKMLPKENYEGVRTEYLRVSTIRSKEILSANSFKPIPMIAKFEHVDGYECFGCKPTRSEGLLLEPKLENGKVVDELVFNNSFAGMNGLVHGGFISMALDEMMGYTITLSKEKLSLTTNLNIEFLRPVKCGEKYRIETMILQHEDSKVVTAGEIIELATGKVCAKGKADFFILNKVTCSRIFPGIYNDPKLSHMYV